MQRKLLAYDTKGKQRRSETSWDAFETNHEPDFWNFVIAKMCILDRVKLVQIIP